MSDFIKEIKEYQHMNLDEWELGADSTYYPTEELMEKVRGGDCIFNNVTYLGEALDPNDFFRKKSKLISTGVLYYSKHIV